MKKFLLGLLVAAMVIGLTACSPEVSSKLGSTMGKMGNNIYGIKANMVQVEKATETVDNSVTKDESGNVTAVDLTTAAQVMNSISSIKGSDQKREALKASLSQPVSTGNPAAVQTAITNSANTKKEALASSTDADQYSQLKTALTTALAAVGTSLTASPTKAELATVAVISEMADAIMTEGITEAQLAQKGQDALDTLKVISDFGGIDLLADADINGLFAALSNKSVSRDDEELAVNMAALYGKSLRKVTEMITEEKAFSEAKYRSFILQAQAMKSAYDMISTSYIADATEIANYDSLLTAKIDHGQTLEDLTKYLVSWLVVEIDDLLGSNLICTFLNGMINLDNYFYMVNAGNPDYTFDGEAAAEAGQDVLDDLFNQVFSDITLDAFVTNAQTDIDEMAASLKELGMSDEEAQEQAELLVIMGYLMDTVDGVINNVTEAVNRVTESIKKLPADFFRFLGTSVVILVDSEWHEGLFSLIKDENGQSVTTVSGMMDAVHNMIANFDFGE